MSQNLVKSAQHVNEDDDVEEFEEDYKKSKSVKKSGKKAYEEDDGAVEAFTPKMSKKYQNAILSDLEGKIADEIAELREHFNWKDIAESIGTMDFFINAKNDECIEKGCDNIRTTQSYCRLHYIRNQKTLQKKREILKENKLQEYIEELISKYPVKYIESLLSDLSDDKEFYKVLNELNITSEFDFEEDELENASDDDDDDGDIGIETISSSLLLIIFCVFRVQNFFYLTHPFIFIKIFTQKFICLKSQINIFSREFKKVILIFVIYLLPIRFKFTPVIRGKNLIKENSHNIDKIQLCALYFLFIIHLLGPAR